MYYFLIFFILILVTILIIFGIWKYESINKLPGPNLLEVLKLFVLNKSSTDLYHIILNLRERYGPVIKIWIKPFRPILIVSDPKYFEVILGSKVHLHKTKLYDLLRSIAGDGLATISDIEKWKSDRIFFNPIFKHKFVSSYTNKLKYHIDNLKQALITYENQPVDVHIMIHHCTMYMILEYLIDDDISVETASDIVHAVDKSLNMTIEREFSAIKSNSVLFPFTKMYKSWVQVHEFLDKIFSNFIHKHINLRKNGPTRPNPEDKNLMDLLLENNFSEHAIMSHLKTFVVAGFGTVAKTASFALFEIAKRKDIQDKIHEEYLSLAGTNKNYVFTFDDIQNMKYTESVIKEAMRMYPAVPMVERQLKSPVIIDGLCIPKDIDIVFSITCLHKYNFSNPEIFNPDRFSPENISDVNPYSYAPFSLGPRNCIGKKIAMIELKYIISHIIKDFTLHSVQPEHKLELANGFTLTSTNGIPVIFKKRVIS